MPRPHRDLERILHIARLHYEYRLTQAEIAAKLSLSVSTVSRYLRQASVLGLVEIRVTSSAYRDFAIEAELADHFPLVSACVVRSAGSAAATERLLATAAARALDELVTAHAVIGVSNGRTLAAMASEARRARTADIDVVTLIGGIGRAESSSQTGEICRTLAERLGGRAWILPVPAVVDSPDVSAALRGTQAAAELFSLTRRLTVAAFGIGAMVPGSSTFQHGLFGDDHLAAMAKRGAVGSICARFYDADGVVLHSAMDACTLSIELDQLARVPARFGVAFGTDKVAAIHAAVHGGLVNHLATDSETAAALIALAAPAERRRPSRGQPKPA